MFKKNKISFFNLIFFIIYLINVSEELKQSNISITSKNKNDNLVDDDHYNHLVQGYIRIGIYLINSFWFNKTFYYNLMKIKAEYKMIIEKVSYWENRLKNCFKYDDCRKSFSNLNFYWNEKRNFRPTVYNIKNKSFKVKNQ